MTNATGLGKVFNHCGALFLICKMNKPEEIIYNVLLIPKIKDKIFWEIVEFTWIRTIELLEEHLWFRFLL